jgi:tetratricopeptide (TPR) repeat protein
LSRGIARALAGATLAVALASAVRAEDAAPPDAAPGAVEAPVPAVAPPSELAPPRVALAIDRLERAWSASASSLGERSERTRAVADEIGVGSLDPLARALLWDAHDSASDFDRASAAAQLAPDLPLAQGALAEAQWSRGDYVAAGRSALDAVHALSANLAGWLWLSITGWLLAAIALAGGSLLFLAARGVSAARFVAHDLGDAIEPSMPTFSRVALLLAVVLAPAALGEGLLGLGVGLVALCCVGASREQRIAVAVAALCLTAAAHPLARRAGTSIAALGAEPALAASWAAESGFLDVADALRLARATGANAATDPLALSALAEWKRRSGDLATADAYYTQLLAGADADVSVLSNAAVLKIALGNPDAAIELYRRALAIEPSALLWFNLAQAHGAAIDVEQHDRALAAAQAMDADVVGELTRRLAAARGPYGAASPLSQSRVRERMLDRPVADAALPLRSVLAPGRLGRSLVATLAAFAIAAVLGVALGARLEPSVGCVDCGAHLCRRCGTVPRGDGRCEACQRRRFEGRGAWDRAQRSLGERLRGLAQRVLPGLVGGAGRGAAFGLGCALAIAGALVFVLGHAAVLPDPGSVGAAGAIAFDGAAAACGVLYLALAALSGFWLRRAHS